MNIRRVMDKDDEASMKRWYEKLCELAKELNISLSDADAEQSLSNAVYQLFIDRVKSGFACGEQELDENPNVAAILAKYKECIMTDVHKLRSEQLHEAYIDYEDKVIDIIGKYVKPS